MLESLSGNLVGVNYVGWKGREFFSTCIISTLRALSFYENVRVGCFAAGKRNPYQFGLGKREPYAFGLGKRADYYGFGLGKREPYSFGLGK
jgi:hypothetical protein